MGLETGVNLLVASLDLELVRLIRGAIAPGIDCGQTQVQKHVLEPRFVHHPDPRIEPRDVYHPTPRFEPRPVYHPTPRFEPLPSAPPIQPEEQVHKSQALPPPWKQPVWETPLPAPVVVKLVQHRPDIVNKGSLIDLFC